MRLLAGFAPHAEAVCASAPAAEATKLDDWVDGDFLRAEQAALGSAVVDNIVEVFRTQGQTLVALGQMRAGRLEPDRVFNL